jgi:hypothetical protein
VHCRIWCSALVVMAVVVWSWEASCVHQCTISTITITCYMDQNRALLGYYAASSGNFLPTFRDNISVPSSGDGNDPLNMGLIGYPEKVGKKLPLLAA